MKRKIVLAAVCSIAIASAVNAKGWGHQDGNGYHGGNGQHRGGGYTQHQNSSATQSALTQEQKDDLSYMYQEEKVARDVYITLGDIWKHRTFLKIQTSEQKHMNAVKNLLQKYSLEVPVVDDTIGVFENAELQALYDELVAKGKKSLRDALEVGKLVEETDINDLEAKMENAPSDINRVFSRLLRGSYNHLRAFNRSLGN